MIWDASYQRGLSKKPLELFKMVIGAILRCFSKLCSQWAHWYVGNLDQDFCSESAEDLNYIGKKHGIPEIKVSFHWQKVVPYWSILINMIQISRSKHAVNKGTHACGFLCVQASINECMKHLCVSCMSLFVYPAASRCPRCVSGTKELHVVCGFEPVRMKMRETYICPALFTRYREHTLQLWNSRVAD